MSLDPARRKVAASNCRGCPAAESNIPGNPICRHVHVDGEVLFYGVSAMFKEMSNQCNLSKCINIFSTKSPNLKET